MTNPSSKWNRWLFEHRVEAASLIGGIGFVFYLFTPRHFTESAAGLVGVNPDAASQSVYIFLALWNLAAGILRIWAGGTLGGARMMNVRVQTDALILSGPYAHVRNPIYLSDIMTLAGMGLVVPVLGGVTVWLSIWFVYRKLTAYEQASLSQNRSGSYSTYIQNVPKWGWRIKPYRAENVSPIEFNLREGLANNFIYLPLVPGFITCAITGVLWHGVAVGAAGPLAWVLLHFWRNFKPGGLAENAHDRQG